MNFGIKFRVRGDSFGGHFINGISMAESESVWKCKKIIDDDDQTVYDYEKSKLYIISIGTDELAHLEVPTDIDWAMIVAYHRGRMKKINDTPFYKKYRDMAADKDLIAKLLHLIV